MTKSEAENLVLFLEMQFGKTYQGPPRDMLTGDLLQFSKESGGKAVDKLLISERFLPAPVVVTRAVAEHASVERENQAARERRESQRPESFMDHPHDTEHAKKACLLVRAIIGGIGREQTIEGMNHMAQLYPNAGWATEAAHLKQFFDFRDATARKNRSMEA